MPIILFLATAVGFEMFTPVKGFEAADIRRVAVSPFNPLCIYVASNNTLYRRNEASSLFMPVASFKEEAVKHIFFDSYIANRLYVATNRHLYKMDNRLKRLFTVADEEILYTAAKHKGVFYVGSSQGLYEAREDLLRWEKSKSIIDTAVYSIDSSADKVYLATAKGVYAISEGGHIERLFVMRKEEEEESEKNSLAIRTIKVDLNHESRIWLGTEQGIFVSEDAGRSWKKLFIEGLDRLSINSLAQISSEKNAIYASTDKGFFLVDIAKQTSQQLFEGLASVYIYWAAFTPSGKLYLASKKGLFESSSFNAPFQSSVSLKNIIANEPTIREVQEAALRYNDVHPEKIRRWRNALYFRAFMPQLDLDYDKSITYDSGSDRYFTGPKDWGVSFSWDIGDLIWNSYQDDVDTRSRLTTQLRLDILDEINRVYFERLRLKQEIASASFDDAELLKKQMRLAELTAIIDGYTGGFFSKKLTRSH